MEKRIPMPSVEQCEEEVNFHLKKSSRFIGETRPRVVQRNVNESLVVCCHLYEMLENEIPSGQVSEVGACGWTPMTVLTDDKYARPLNWSKFRNIQMKIIIILLCQVCGIISHLYN